MTATSTVQARIDSELKEEAEEILRDIGLSISDGMRIFLRQVVNTRGLPFQPTTRPAIEITRDALREDLSEAPKFTNTADLFAYLSESDEPIDD